jgi:hypothetical protein
VLFVLRALLERLVRELVLDARAAASVAVTLVLDAGRQWPLSDDEADAPVAPVPVLTPESLLAVPHRTITREARPARPLARLDPLFDQCRALLERWSIPAPIIGVAVSIPATAPLAADQGDLLLPSWRDAAMNADAVFSRLRAALDPDGAHHVVVHPVAGDAHRPEEAARWEHAEAMTSRKNLSRTVLRVRTKPRCPRCFACWKHRKRWKWKKRRGCPMQSGGVDAA